MRSQKLKKYLHRKTQGKLRDYMNLFFNIVMLCHTRCKDHKMMNKDTLNNEKYKNVNNKCNKCIIIYNLILKIQEKYKCL